MVMLHDLLDRPLLTWRDVSRRRHPASLPAVISHLASGELSDFPRLRTHQLQPWCMFLTQLVAIALHRVRETNPNRDEAAWRDLLLSLTDGRHEPWCLVVDDLAQPAFFQPPVPEGALGDRWQVRMSPDDIDILVTAKSHDIKAGTVPSDDLEAWAYALVTLQTMQGYPGRGYTGISRMNGGYGNRPRVGLSQDQSLTARFLRDVEVLSATWPLLLERGFRDDGVGLTWTQPWDGVASLALGDLSPHFVEICWRLRCTTRGTSVVCSSTTTSNRRCAPEVEGGDVGDPWAPIERDGGMLTVGGRGFHYDLLRRLLFENDFEPAAAQVVRPYDPDAVLMIATALARGQGKTDGLHERVLEIARPVKWRLGRAKDRAILGTRAAARVSAAERMHDNVLYPALKTLGVVGRDEFDGRVDDVFFDHLFTTLDDSDEDARLAWESKLRELAQGELRRAISRCALPSARRFKVTSAAEGMFSGCLRKNFPDISNVSPEEEGAPR